MLSKLLIVTILVCTYLFTSLLYYWNGVFVKVCEVYNRLVDGPHLKQWSVTNQCSGSTRVYTLHEWTTIIDMSSVQYTSLTEGNNVVVRAKLKSTNWSQCSLCLVFCMLTILSTTCNHLCTSIPIVYTQYQLNSYQFIACILAFDHIISQSLHTSEHQTSECQLYMYVYYVHFGIGWGNESYLILQKKENYKRSQI